MSSLRIDRLSVPERFQLVQEIWDSIAPSAEQLPLTEAERTELDRRPAAGRVGAGNLRHGGRFRLIVSRRSSAMRRNRAYLNYCTQMAVVNRVASSLGGGIP